MSDDPQLEDVRDWYIAGRRTRNPFASDATLVERFDTWLAAHDREVAAQALRDAAQEWPLIIRDGVSRGSVHAWLRAHADQIEDET